jgi:hypothetical protein
MIKTDPPNTDRCVPMPDFERLQYYYGRNLTVADFQVEQRYFLEKLRLHNRCFHGTGIVCGLEVRPVPGTEECDDNDKQRREIQQELRRIAAELKELEAAAGEASEEKRKQLEAEQEELRRRLEQLPDCHDPKAPTPVQVWVDCGWAIDCHGREIIVREPQRLDLDRLLSSAERRQLREMGEDPDAPEPILELSICYCEQKTYPTRPMVADNCDIVDKCKYGRVREGYRLHLSLVHQAEDRRCSNCCEPCEQECVVLAHIHWRHGAPLTAEDIDWSPRRSVSVYQPAVIEGISWQHGATYDQSGTKQVLGTANPGGAHSDGIEVRFSRPVCAESLQPGTVDFYCEHGGKGLAGVVSRIEGSFVGKPDHGPIDSFRYRDESGETLNSGDRVLIVIRCNFILDECCQPVDGEHVGGLVPQLEAYVDKPAAKSTPPRPLCATRPQPWTSGNGRPGATFESWFFVE